MENAGPQQQLRVDATSQLAEVDRLLGQDNVLAARVAASDALSLAVEPSVTRAQLMLRLAYCDLAMSRASRAFETALSAAELFRSHQAGTDEVNALAVVSNAATRLGRATEAVEAALLATRLSQEELPRGPWAARAQASLATAYGWAGSFAKASRAFEEAAELAQRLAGPQAGLEVRAEQALVELFRQATERNASNEAPDPTALARLLECCSELNTCASGELLTPGSLRKSVLTAALCTAFSQCWAGRLDLARDSLCAAQSQLKPEDGASDLVALGAWLGLELAVKAGPWDEASTCAARMTAAAVEAEHEPLVKLGHELACYAFGHQGRDDLALNALRLRASRERQHRAVQLDSRDAIVSAQLVGRRSAQSIQALTTQSQEFERLAYEDWMTGIANVRRFQQRLPQWLAQCRDTGQPLSIAFFDVNHFKRVNDDFGHDVGNDVLRIIASHMVPGKHAREGDLPARLHGDEFTLLFRNANEAVARDACHRIATAVRAHDWDSIAQGLKVSVSYGVVQARPDDTAKTLVKRSDEAMYARKSLRHDSEPLFEPTVDAIPPLLLERIARWLAHSKRLVIFTGTGHATSAEGEVDPANIASWPVEKLKRFAHIEGYRAEPKAFVTFWQELRGQLASQAPPPLYRALVELSRFAPCEAPAPGLPPAPTFITERVDGMLQKAGAQDVVEMYGNAFSTRCAVCGAQEPGEEAGRCAACHSPADSLRPDIVLLGDSPSARILARAELRAKTADLILVLDTDAHIFPGAAVLDKARYRGAKVVMLGTGPYTRRSAADVSIRAPAQEVVELLLQRLRSEQASPSPAADLSDGGLAALCYLTGNGTDHLGRTFEQALALSDREIAHNVNVTQWQFPLTTRSTVCPEAPAPTRQDFLALSGDHRVQHGLRRSFEQMLRFYGFRWRDGRVSKVDDWQERFRGWTRTANHNDLRISRILGSLTLCGLRQEAAAFLAALEEEVPSQRISGLDRTMNFWKGAVGEQETV